jgi:hypothetical protein
MTRLQRRDHDPFEITEGEAKQLRSTKMPAEIRQFLNGNTAELADQIRVGQKAAALARSRREAIKEIRELGALEADYLDALQMREQLEAAERKLNAIETTLADKDRQLAEKDRQIAQLTAAPAMAVHARGRDA